MADKIDKPASTSIEKDALVKLVEKIESAKGKASEHNGSAGQAISAAVEKQGINRKGLTFVMQLRKKDDLDRQSALRSVIDYAHKLDMFSGVDAFDDLVDRMDEIVQEIRARKHNGVDNVVGMTTGGSGKEASQ